MLRLPYNGLVGTCEINKPCYFELVHMETVTDLVVTYVGSNNGFFDFGLKTWLHSTLPWVNFDMFWGLFCQEAI